MNLKSASFGILATAGVLLSSLAGSAQTVLAQEETAIIYRLYNRNTGEHFYTANKSEKNQLVAIGWTYEGIGWYGPISGDPVYRVYNPNAAGGDHYYTANQAERDYLVNQGWKPDYNGEPVFYSGGDIPLYVAYNPNAQSGSHNYTTADQEQQYLLSIGWTHGAKAWNVLQVGEEVAQPPKSMYTVDGILIVNKKYSLPADYAPGENPEAKEHLLRLIGDMKALGMNISDRYSGYRSYAYQGQVYRNYCAQYGQAQADTFSARSGYSEHQTGLAFDLTGRNGELLESPREVQWLLDHAAEYGFIVRYQNGKEHITGYIAEPWHLRYVGEAAKDIATSGLTLEEYLGVEGGGY